MLEFPAEIDTSFSLPREEILEDYRQAYISRQASLIGRREVLTGKAKFGIFGDGKELAQVAMAKYFRNGDIRSGYYRDMTFHMLKGIQSLDQLFSQLYSNPDLNAEPHSGGRQMNSHVATRMLNDDGTWRNLTDMPITTSDVSCTAGQMPRIAGLVQASVLYRNSPELEGENQFSINGNEVVFGTIGNASCAEGVFWETINAVGVIGGPLVMSIWDDGYGISVPNEYQITKSNIGEVLSGFQRNEEGSGYNIYSVQGWDYIGLCKVYQQATENARVHHIPSIIHVTEVTQPQGHSTSGSHERYKSTERLQWEKDFDCLKKMRDWILEEEFIDEETLLAQEKADRVAVRKIKNEAWENYQAPFKAEAEELTALLTEIISFSRQHDVLRKITSQLRLHSEFNGRLLMEASHKALLALRNEQHPNIEKLKKWRKEKNELGEKIYDTYLFSDTASSPLKIAEIPAQYAAQPRLEVGFNILNEAFEHIFESNPKVLAFGEDVGHLGDVNQGFAGLQQKFGRHRITDTGIRELTIMGQAIGLSLRGFRPIAEIQYLDYLIYGLQPLVDDATTLSYRTARGQKCPFIVRTRGHRLEGIWHSGSPIGMIIHALRGMHLLVPRNMVQAAGFYHTLLAGDEPGLIIEVLNGYRVKEEVPENLHEFNIPLGVPEIIREGEDITLVTYGACCQLAEEAANELESVGISVEVIDVRSLLPFDIHHSIVESLKKTNRIIFVDEDMPGGATSFMYQQVMEKQGGYYHLDSEAICLTAKEHRPAYGDDGDYWSKPQADDIFRVAYEMMNEVAPEEFPIFY